MDTVKKIDINLPQNFRASLKNLREEWMCNDECRAAGNWLGVTFWVPFIPVKRRVLIIQVIVATRAVNCSLLIACHCLLAQTNVFQESIFENPSREQRFQNTSSQKHSKRL